MLDFSKIEDFSRHISMSIPNYDGLCDVFMSFVYEFAHPEGCVVDIGCSTGTFLNHIHDSINDVRCVGVDSVNFNSVKHFDFIHDDCDVFLKNTEYVDIVISMFTLQFLGKHKRRRVVENLKRLVDGGAVLLISEKIILESRIESVMKRAHLQDKRKHFTDTEILDKDYDLFGSMFCLTEKSLMDELESIGRVSRVWQSYNFVGFVIHNQ